MQQQQLGIDTIEGVDLNFNELITVTDLSPAEVSFDASGVDLKTPVHIR